MNKWVVLLIVFLVVAFLGYFGYKYLQEKKKTDLLKAAAGSVNSQDLVAGNITVASHLQSTSGLMQILNTLFGQVGSVIPENFGQNLSLANLGV